MYLCCQNLNSATCNGNIILNISKFLVLASRKQNGSKRLGWSGYTFLLTILYLLKNFRPVCNTLNVLYRT